MRTRLCKGLGASTAGGDRPCNLLAFLRVLGSHGRAGGPILPAAVAVRAVQVEKRPPPCYRPGQVTADRSRRTLGLLGRGNKPP